MDLAEHIFDIVLTLKKYNFKGFEFKVTCHKEGKHFSGTTFVHIDLPENSLRISGSSSVYEGKIPETIEKLTELLDAVNLLNDNKEKENKIELTPSFYRQAIDKFQKHFK